MGEHSKNVTWRAARADRRTSLFHPLGHYFAKSRRKLVQVNPEGDGASLTCADSGKALFLPVARNPPSQIAQYQIMRFPGAGNAGTPQWSRATCRSTHNLSCLIIASAKGTVVTKCSGCSM